MSSELDGGLGGSRESKVSGSCTRLAGIDELSVLVEPRTGSSRSVMPSFEGSGRFCLVDCEFGSRRLKIESSVVVACEGWLLSLGSSETAKTSKAAERRRLWRSFASETAVEVL